ncbi:cystathionine gamma-synthase/cystathionine gamma-lyase/cystathionine beta-lyase [Salinibacter ruber]|uniref:trans-sulfuration enzyme family protein n=1 Tax=Salinibacter ruber TaxID=146919 RepID=UPI00216A8FD1|nr:PLP-dependent aspartate aminotransferase family protein [Salinibacter ruber]MCS3627391.1 cystathionine gamma-synthase/cystathionine gamma-lyase/cystathionine beta-lyase [Salinibacter ruber]MCS3825410.1 cystathionine gamma-synthase/cystathionine gamma-lyase/cystathionine beta-lyase [Salinibacter ruber]MCS4144282.1 cystathionine gamma-synthase/cystathionine gamma-lyase/cystathionine beta-lyase [Salinibacter ruber]
MSTLDTQSIHAGEPEPRIEGAVSMPVFQTATYTHDDPGASPRYVRYNNSPNHEALHEKLAALTETERALVTASGMAAISSALLGVLEAGDHLVAPHSLYGGTLALLNDLLPRFGIAHTLVPEDTPEAWTAALQPNTKVLYAEAITNPRLDVLNLTGMVDLAEEHDLTTVIDNTFASPVNLRPASLGFDVVLHSATKYLGGHSDVAAGVVAGASKPLDNALQTTKLLGGMLDPHACGLLHRSLKTLGVRVRKQNETARALAAALADHDGVERVHHPSLSSHPHHDRARTLLDGFGGMVGLELAPQTTVDSFFDALSLPLRAPSLGGVETLVTQPVHTSHKDVAPAARRAMGITDRFVRVSVGLEGPKDLVADFAAALDAGLDE